MSRSNPKVIAVIGSKKSGKTSLAEILISSLSEKGFKVGSIKHIHEPDFSIDTRGRDTWRHMEAGSRVTASVAQGEVSVIRRVDTRRYGLDDVKNLIKDEDVDLIVIEGFKNLVSSRKDVLKIVAAKSLSDLETFIPNLTQPAFVASKIKLQGKETFKNFDIIDMSKDQSKLVQLVEKKLP